MRSTLPVAGLVVALLAAVARGDDGRVFQLLRRAPAVGDAFRVELETSFRHGVAGQPLRDGVTTRSAITCKLQGQHADTGAFDAQIVLDPQTTIVEDAGVAATTTESGRTIVKPMTARELELVPTLQLEGAAEPLAGRTKLVLGDTWTSENVVPIGGIAVPVTGTYRVSSVEKDPGGREVVKIEFASRGSTKAAGSTFSVSGKGHALVDPARAERPVEVELSYTFVAEGDGEAVESRSDTKIRTCEVGK